MKSRVPEFWRKKVVEILREAPDYTNIRFTERALNDLDSLFPELFRVHHCSLLIDALLEEIEGQQIFNMMPPGETWAFIFNHSSVPVYAKICLRDDQELIVIFSAHRPLKGDTL